LERGIDARPPAALADVSYDPNPRYPVADGEVEVGYGSLADDVGRDGNRTLAIDGPAALSWDRFLAGLVQELGRRNVTAELVDARRFLAPWEEIKQRTARSVLGGDPVFGRIFEGALAELFDELPRVQSGARVVVVFGPGSAFVEHDLLWYADLPKRLSLTAVRRGGAGNLGQSAGQAGTEQQLLFVDWPVLERHKQELLPRLDRYVDLSEYETPRSLVGEALRRTLYDLAGSPFRTRPTFLPGPWGGQWLRDTLGISTDAPNLAWSYELITPESGILLGTEEPIEVGFELLMAAEGDRVLGAELAMRFGVSFPIRFDYLDTFGGGHLSIQCHPSAEYMRETFGLPYTQHETYYVVDTKPGAEIFLGLREDADLEAFRVEAERAEDPGLELEPGRYLQTHPAVQHRLYLIPAGTPHASGADNIVLEISATPYLYTLRFYDWLRRDLEGELRPVHLVHAFSNLDPLRSGESVRRELIPEPRPVRKGTDWVELELGRLPDLFFAVHRVDFEEAVDQDTAGRFHVLNLVAGQQVEIESETGVHGLAYAETIVVPAAVGQYRLRRARGGACKVVKAFVP
jgi:mannose-6-phosphate isomerase class I